MILTDIIAIVVIAIVIVGAVLYIVKAKKSGKKCIGCPDSCSCNAKKQDGGCGTCGDCHCHDENK